MCNLGKRSRSVHLVDMADITKARTMDFERTAKVLHSINQDCTSVVVKRNEEYAPNSDSSPTRIVASAVLQEGHLWTARRHHEIIKTVFNDTWKRVTQDQQGFLTDTGHFVTRDEAKLIACRNGQLQKDFDKTLLSEDLW